MCLSLLTLETTLRFLRSRFFSILIAALVLVGYSEVVRGFCSHECAEAEVSEAGEGHSDDQDCQCVCHQSFPHERSAPPALVGRLFEADLVFAEIADSPPDAVPLGIDHPPQIA